MSERNDDTEPREPPVRHRAHSAAGLLALALEDDEEPRIEHADPLEQKPGDQIGRYKLITQLGEGGFGIVWEAEQRMPIKRDVALKIIRPGMDSRTVISRFRAEQRALERMEHPHIAAVLDAGATEQGRPYFVMELVKGRPITHYADEQSLGLQARLELFIDVCRAVQHAHQKGIMHRDLKPSNILVFTQDGRPVPKVIDFGIAKALTDDVDGLGSLAYTAQGLVLGTPQYMAPEQAVMGGGDMDIRVDVYSLGSILYELLTGSAPMILNRGSKTSVDKLLRRIHDEEAEAPSERARQRDAQLKSVPVKAAQLKGDLDWICLRALEKDPDRRYGTASVLAEEVLRYLNDEPVHTGPPDMWYRLQKLVRRHRTPFIAAGVVVFTLVAATVLSVNAFLRESAARRLAENLRLQAEASQQAAETASQKATGVAGFLYELLHQAGQLVDQGKNPEALRLALDQSAERLEALHKQPELQAQLFGNLADVYALMGDEKRALTLRYRQLDSMKTLYGPTDTRTLKKQLEISYGEADQGNKQKALELCDETIRQFEGAGKKGTGDWFDAVSQRAIQLGRMRKSADSLKQMLAIQGYKNSRGVPAMNDNAFLRRLAELQSYAGDFDAARATLERCLQYLPKGAMQRLDSRQAALASLARVDASQNRHADAARHFQESISVNIEMRGPEYHPLIEMWIDLARQYVADMRWEEAINATDSALVIARVNGTDEKLPHALRASAEVRQQAGRLDSALPFRSECFEAQHRLKPETNLWIDDHMELAVLLSRLGRDGEAEQMVPVLWRETQDNPSAWNDGSFVHLMCVHLAEICRKWQAVTHSTAHDQDIAMWKAKQLELEKARDHP